MQRQCLPLRARETQLVSRGPLVCRHPSLRNGSPQQNWREGGQAGRQAAYTDHGPSHSFLVFGNLLVLPRSAGTQSSRRLSVHPSACISHGRAAGLRVWAAAGQTCAPELPDLTIHCQVTGSQCVSLKKGVGMLFKREGSSTWAQELREGESKPHVGFLMLACPPPPAIYRLLQQPRLQSLFKCRHGLG